MRLGVLGPLEVETAAGERLVVAAPKQRTVLACLALRANLKVSTDALMDSVWPERQPANAKPAILNYVARLRRNLLDVAERVQTTAGGYRLEVREDRELDHVYAAALAAAARKAVCGGDWHGGERQADAALSLWRGEPLEDVPCDRLRADWLPSFDALRLRLEETRLDALLAAGHFDRALPRLMELSTAHPLLEPLHERAVVALYGSGRRAEALRCYGAARSALRDGIGADPSPCLQDLHALVLRDAPVSELVAVWRAARALAHSGESARTEPAPSAPLPRADGFPPSQLPRPPRTVVGRERELRRLSRMLAEPGADDVTGAGGGVRVAAVVGPAGVGKTTLALAWAHGVADRFPDGQLYLDLNGFTAEGGPVAPDAAVGTLLDFLGVPAAHLPATPEGRAALYRGLIAGKRLLLVLDNVRDAAQVRPLLPSGQACRVLVTSRRSLGSLVALDGAEALSLAPLNARASRELLVGRLGARRSAGQGPALEAIAERCAHLPLALSVAATRAAATSAAPLSAFATRLERGALDALSAGDDASSVRSVLSWSCTGLTAPAARVFGFLGLHPGGELTVSAAAALADLPPSQAGPLVEELAAMSLLTEQAPGRYAMHGLLREFAAELIDAEAGPAQRHAARHRLYDYYLRTALAADRACGVGPAPVRADEVPLPPGLAPTGFSGRDAALAWLADEQQQLAILLSQASSHGLGSYAWRLAVAQSRGLALRGGHEEELRLARVALGTAKRLGDATGQGCCYLLIGRALARVGELPTARFQLRRALGLFRSADAVTQLADVHQALGDCAYRQGRYREFAAHARSRLAAARRSGDPVARCHALDGLGWALLQCGDYREAHVHCLESLALARDLGLPHAERELLDVDRSLARAELLAADGELEQARAVWLDVGRLTRLRTPTRAEYAGRRLDAFRIRATAPR